MRALVACVMGLAAVPVVADDTFPYRWRLLETVAIYRAGDTQKALELLGKEEVETQRRAAREMIKNHRVLVRGIDPPGPAGPPWTIPLLNTAGALHMEYALALYKQRGADGIAALAAQIEIAEILFDGIAAMEKRRSDAARWEWTIGQQALSDGSYEIARLVLGRSSERYPDDVPLLLASGTIHETYAGFNIDIEAALKGTGTRRRGNILHDPAVMTPLHARSDRNSDLRRARESFERVQELDRDESEASLRLGHVRLKLGDAEPAASVLEPLVRASGDGRTAYLARLFLGRVRERQQRNVEAVALFREALSLVPAQSARVALTYRMLAEGRGDEARQLAEAITAGGDVDDPWWSYRFGQYWLTQDTLATLRAEARR